MALTPEVRTPQAGVLCVARINSKEVLVPQGSVSVVYNIPSPELRVTSATVTTVQRKPSPDLKTTQSYIIAVTTGTIATPKIKAWGYTLDGHDMYVLKLGTGNKTLIYDLSTGQWSWWCSGERPSWRASTGLNWVSSGSIPSDKGSNVIVGDDSSGVLWVLDPEFGLDEGAFDEEARTFERIATAQMTEVGRSRDPIYSVYLQASFGKPSAPVNSVTLEYSDNRGKTYETADEPQVSLLNNYTQEVVWRSIGRIKAPGRLFRLRDEGAFARIDCLEVNE